MTKKETRIRKCGRASIVFLIFLGAVAGYVGILMMVDSQGVKSQLTQAVAAATGLQSLFWIGLLVFCVDCVLTGGLVWLLIDDMFHHRKKTLPMALILTGSFAALVYSDVESLFYSNICLTASVMLLVLSIISFITKPTPKLK